MNALCNRAVVEVEVLAAIGPGGIQVHRQAGGVVVLIVVAVGIAIEDEVIGRAGVKLETRIAAVMRDAALKSIRLAGNVNAVVAGPNYFKPINASPVARDFNASIAGGKSLA